ncbi:MAG: lytic transglycosylase domain-containing protein [Myxococcales bacterium]|nr:lytic transglycosylase domain-containing protein [Myxococcales bacterium]
MLATLQRFLVWTLCLCSLSVLPRELVAQDDLLAESHDSVGEAHISLGHSHMAMALRQHAVALQGGGCSSADATALDSLVPDAAEPQATRSRLLSTQAFLQGESLRCLGQSSQAVDYWRRAAALDPVWTTVVNRRLLAAGEAPVAWRIELGGAGSQRLWSRAIADPNTRATAIAFLLQRYESGTCSAWLRRQIAAALESVPAEQRTDALDAWLHGRIAEAEDLPELMRRLTYVSALPSHLVTRLAAHAVELARQGGWSRNRDLLHTALVAMAFDTTLVERFGSALPSDDSEYIAALQNLRMQLRDVRLVAWRPQLAPSHERQVRRMVSVMLMRALRRGNHDRDALSLVLQELPLSASLRAEFASACVQLAGLADQHVIQRQCLMDALVSDLPQVEQAHLVIEAVVDALAVGDHRAAARVLENALVLALLTDLPAWEAQRLAYWRARVRLESGDRVAAVQQLRQVRRMAPLAYYGVMADGWLQQLGGHGQFRALLMTLQVTPAVAPDDPRASTALALLDAGLSSLAREELLWQAQFFGADAPVVAALAGVLQAERGELANAMWTLTRLADVEHWSQQQLAALPRQVIFHAWPTAFEKAVMSASAQTGVDAAWLYAFIRRESAFTPNARSSAGAQGLMQLLPSTARRLAASVWAAGPPEPFNEPQVNVLLGATFLRQRLAMAGGCIEPAIAAYSAGPAHARNWLQHTPDAWNDVWLERVSYPTVRDYVRDVVPAAAMYRAVLRQPWQSPICRVNANELAQHSALPPDASL